MSDEYDNNKSYQAQSSEVMDGSTGSVNPDIDYVKRYCVSLLRNNAKRDAILAATLQELAEAHVTIAKAEQALSLIHI